jgi:hypothetical protein
MNLLHKTLLTICILIMIVAVPFTIMMEDMVKYTNFLWYYAAFFFIIGLLSGLFIHED